MAQPQVIDIGMLYEIGRASAPGVYPKGYKRRTPWLAKAAFSFVGNQALNYFNDAWDKKKQLAGKQEIFDADFASTVSEEKGYMSELFNKAIPLWQEERNRGQNLVSKYHGFPNSKKYKEGIALMNNAQSKLEKLHKDASERLISVNDYKSVEKTGTITGDDGKPVKVKYASHNDSIRMHNTMSLANGDMDSSFTIDEKTGGLLLARETKRGGFGPEGLVDETKIDYIPFNEIKFAKFEDTTVHNLGKTHAESGTKYGGNGIVWDESHEMGVRADITQDFEDMEPDSFRSWFFGGTQYKYADSGKTFMTPAQDFIAEKYSDIKPGTVEYEGILDTLKGQDLNSPEYKEFAINSMLDVNKQFHNNAYRAWEEKHRKAPSKRTQWEQERLDNKNEARFMYSGKNETLSDDKKTKYVQDGKGNSTIYIRAKDEDGAYFWNEWETVTTEVAVNRKLGLVDAQSPYTIEPTTATDNPITDYEKRNGKWYYIKGGKNKAVNKSNYPRLEAQAKIAKYS